MEIRKLLPTDDPYAVSAVYEQSWKSAYKGIIPQSYLDSIPAGRWVTGIRQHEQNCLVLIENGTIIGTSRISKSRWEAYSDYGEIISIYLLPEYVGKGYGRALMDRAVEELKQAGYRHLLLWVLEENHRARRFYETYGFTLSEEKLTQNIGGKELSEVMYVYQL